jgi:hypothetical protein
MDYRRTQLSYCWHDEVYFVIRKGKGMVGLEVKTGGWQNTKGIAIFK